MVGRVRRWWGRAAESVPMVDMPADVPALTVPPVPAPLARYVIDGMSDIDGWGIDPFVARILVMLDAVQRDRGIAGTLFELGVHEGKASVLLALLARPGEAVVLVDLFEDRQDENIDRSGYGSRVRLEENLARWAGGTRPEIVQANSLELDFTSVPGLAAGVRLAHIDGGHHLEAVLNDLTKTEAVLAEGGVVVVDDFMHSGFPEVNEGCHRFFDAGTALVPVAMGQNKLILARPGIAPLLSEDLAVRMAAPYGKPVRFHGHPCLCLDHH